MPFAITASCCSDAQCVSVCPVGCIHPAPGEPGFGTSEILHIDPAACIDCGACADACPVNAIFPVDKLAGPDREYAEINASYYTDHDDVPPGRAPYPFVPRLRAGLRVAVVGTGPAGMYTVRDLLGRTECEITVFDALPTPGGLLRSGVAPDHPETKRIQHGFDLALRHPRVRFVGGVEVGRDVSIADLEGAFDAVFLASGARRPRRLGVPGEDSPGVVPALDVVTWAGGVPGRDSSPIPELGSAGTARAVIVGTGNVALDVARLLTLRPEDLGRTDAADRALDVLRARPIRDVVVLGRGDSSRAAYTQAEFRTLHHVPGLEVRVVEADAPFVDSPPPTETRVTFLFGSSISRVDGDGPLTVHLDRAGDGTALAADLLVTSIGHDVEPFDELHHDPSGALRHDAGRVRPGLYATGWLKRGATGGIGANRACAQESVDSFLRDATDDALPPRAAERADLLARLKKSGAVVDLRGARAIDRRERLDGERVGRPRVKITSLDELLATARRRAPRR